MDAAWSTIESRSQLAPAGPASPVTVAAQEGAQRVEALTPRMDAAWSTIESRSQLASPVRTSGGPDVIPAQAVQSARRGTRSRSREKACAGADPAALASKQITFGRHAGKSYEEVRRTEPGYCRWALSQERPGGALAPFVRYLRLTSAQQEAAPGTARPALLVASGSGGSAERELQGSEPVTPKRQPSGSAVSVGFKDGTSLPGQFRDIQSFMKPQGPRRGPATPQAGGKRQIGQPQFKDIRGFLRPRGEAHGSGEGPIPLE
eukprot:CAMPEP_0171195544 /NCGR_PEP_ID=MMETSP0790-20130122/21450_1 /TAXON_ID=2925 /ORGANISM="Alexandrium catenella, Strain OF101" /LENGTH=261 /DNA_ID=CAMNT_0011660757 /DNA_START=1 /DNA_END=786 /DNA_ORIENTATION=+